jgi:hypothetical protein
MKKPIRGPHFLVWVFLVSRYRAGGVLNVPLLLLEVVRDDESEASGQLLVKRSGQDFISIKTSFFHKAHLDLFGKAPGPTC